MASQPSGTQIDRALQDFLAVRAALRGQRDQGVVNRRAWHSVLESIDAACEIAPVGDDLGAFVRARATLEVELHQDKTRQRQLPGDVEKRLARTLASIDLRMSELRAVGAPGMLRPTPLPDGGIIVLLPPVSPLVVSSPFGVRTDPIHGRTRFHAGIDLSAPFGTPVHASAAGSVVYAGWQGGYGRHVVVDHGGGIRTHYSHMHKLYVRSGAKVGPGDTIGLIGATGRATGPHLHFAVTNLDGAFLDPGALVNQPFYAAPPEVATDEVAAETAAKTNRTASRETFGGDG